MRLLLDTHALLWLLIDDRRLGPAAREVVSDPENEVFVSVASLWEITLKVRIGKLSADVGEILAACRDMGLRRLDISNDHLTSLAKLPLVPEHRDPFDHLLIAQALAEGLVFLSSDSNAGRYPINILPCDGAPPNPT